MRNMMLQERNYKSLVLAALLIGAVSTALAWETCGINLEYEIDGTTLRLQSPDPTINAQFSSASAIIGNTTITSVSFPSNVTLIGTQAFNGCTALANVDFGNVQTISSYAFYGCTALTEVVLPPTITAIDGSAFYGCSSLTDVLCRPYPAPSLGTDAFTECSSSLKICVSSLGEYHNKDVNWKSYYDALTLTECFLDENDEQTTVSGKLTAFRNTSKTDIDVFRTLRKAGCFNTLTLPFSVPDISASPLAGAEVYTFSSATVEEGTLVLEIEQVTSNTLTAGTPYLIQWDNTGEVLNRMTFTGITWDDDQEASTVGTGDVNYIGFYGRKHIDDDANHSNLFLAGNNELYWPSDGDDENAKMLGFRAYFHAVTGVALSPVRKGMPAALRIKSTPTDIESPSPSGEGRGEASKELRNGQIIIIRNGESYSITGQRL